MCVKDAGRKASSEVINEKTKKSKSWIWLNGIRLFRDYKREVWKK